MIEDFKENLSMVICTLSFVIMIGILALSVAGVINMFEDPGAQLVWWVSAGLFLFSNIALCLQARGGEVLSREWSPSIESPLRPLGPSKQSPLTEPSKLSSPMPLGVSMSQPLADLEDLETLEPTVTRLREEAPTLDESPSIALDKPTKEQLDILKKTLNLTEGSLHFKSNAVHIVRYDKATKKHVWRRLGSWPELRQKLSPTQNPS